MRNKIFNRIIFIIIIYLFVGSKASVAEEFNFDVTTIEIIEKGNKIIGSNGGKITTDDNLIIKANKFIYNKLKNTLRLSGEVSIQNLEKKFKIYANQITYFKNEEIIITDKNSKYFLEDHKEIIAQKFKLDRKKNSL